MKFARKIELLSPAKNLECGIEAIKHGADAVYIGAPRFSARAAADNSINDIKKLVEFAHQYYAKIYVALNTILYDSEIPIAEKLVQEIYEIGADALIIQDMGLLTIDLPPIPIHASTQTDNRTLDKIKFLENAGFSQVVLARELTLTQIKEIAGNTKIPLEVFIHGALCVCYSGQCYISEALSKRSANRGICAQYCRMPYTLQDAEGKTIASGKHLLSMKDLNQSEYIEDLLDAGVTSLKIEGRLKDITYVKNITAYYRKKLDEIFLRRSEYTAASSGHCTFDFFPDPSKSFNRGFTNYFLKGRTKDMASMDTPKSLGEPIGNINDINRNYFTYSGKIQVNNGDGLCFICENKELQGLRVNKVEGKKIFPAEMPRLLRGIPIFRNFDHEFEKKLLKNSAERKIDIEFILEENSMGFTLRTIDENGCTAQTPISCKKELSQKDQKENIKIQLSKLGNTIFKLTKLQINLSDNWFIPSSILSELKRAIIDALILQRNIHFPKSEKKLNQTCHPYLQSKITYLGNISNKKAKEFYKQHSVDQIEPAYELIAREKVPLMYTKFCIRYNLGYCSRLQGSKGILKEPLYLLSNNIKLKLEFDCDNCEMIVKKDN